MKMDDVQVRQIETLGSRLSHVRLRLQEALDAAQGNQQDANVQQISAEFDRLLVEYMRLTQLAGRKASTRPENKATESHIAISTGEGSEPDRPQE